MITVCCLKWGSLYKPEQYNVLYSMVVRNLKQPFEFVCFTDDPAGLRPEIRCCGIPHDLPYWWGKVALYKDSIPGVVTEKILFLDTDVVILRSIDEIADYPSDFAMARDFPQSKCPARHEKDVNGSVILLKVGARTEIWDHYVRLGMPQMPIAEAGKKNFTLGGQGIINEVRIPVDQFPDDWVRSYKDNNMAIHGPGDDCRIAFFHGHPKPWEVEDAWVKEHWV